MPTTTMIRSKILFLLLLCTTTSSNAFTTTTATTTTVSSSSSSRYMSSSTDDVAQGLRDKAAKIRAEIAAMEGKTVQEVETEAKEKKESETLRRDALFSKTTATTTTTSTTGETKTRKSGVDQGRYLEVPNTADDMTRQAARAVERAFKDGKTRQTVRFNLISEEQSAVDENEWPGGTQQIYRESAKPLTTELLREIRAPTKMGDDQYNNTEQQLRRLPPTLRAQDIWDFDGSALHTAEAAEGPSADIQAMVLPNTDVKYIRDIEKISEAMKNRLFLLVNPFWRNVDSWSFNLLAPGAKQKAQSVIFDQGYDDTYHLLVFSVRGEKCVGLKAYPYDWQLFAYLEDDYYNTESVIRLGSCEGEPTSQLVTGLLNERPEFKETKTMRQMKKLF
jgi:hypothetical protein